MSLKNVSKKHFILGAEMLFEIFESLLEMIHESTFVYSCFLPPFIDVFLKIWMSKP
jgi:hypothetical protein